MRFHEFTTNRPSRPINRSHVATLTVEPGQWEELRRVRDAQTGLTRIIAVRTLGTLLKTSSVEIECEDWESKVKLTLDWYAVTVLFADVKRQAAEVQDREFAHAEPEISEQCSTATLYVAHPEEWQRLDDLRGCYGPTTITGQRDLAPRFPGWSVDVHCGSPDEAALMLGDWCSGQVRRSGVVRAEHRAADGEEGGRDRPRA